MAISPIESIIFTNQNMQIAASRQIDHQGSVDFQNLVAAATTNNKTNEVGGTSAAKEDKEVDPDREHNKERAEEEAGEKEQETAAKTMYAKKEETPVVSTHILDIKV